jgi:O-antigen/teichoic acid export membrane protein
LSNIIKKLFKNKFIRNVVVVASGTAGAQAISMAFSPIITRLYGPEAFGLMGTFMAIASIVTPLAAFSYPIAIVLPEKDRDAKGIACLSFYLASGVTCLVTLFLLLAGDWLIKILRVQDISSFIFLIPLAMLFAASLQIMGQWLIRKKHFGITARVAVLQAFIINIAKTGIGLFNPAAASLIIISIFGSGLQAFMLAIGAKKAEKYTSGKWVHYSPTELWELAKKHYDFPLYRAPQIFINSFSQSLPVLMLAAFFGPASAGFYALCERLLDIPSQLIGQSVTDVFYPRITEAARNGEKITFIILKATLTLAAVGFFPFALIIAFGPWFFGFAFGNEWVQAGEYARWLALWMFFSFINRPSIASIPVLRMQGLLLIYEVFSVFLRVLALGIGFYAFNNDILAIALFSLAGTILNFSLIIVICCSDRLAIQNKRIV